MAQAVHALTAKEKEALRLLLEGHDAKSMARQLGLSVHTVNERLRLARRKLEVSSSKEAARMLRDAEGAGAQRLADRSIGGAPAAPVDLGGARPGPDVRAKARTVWAVGGLAICSFALAAVALPGMTAMAPNGAAAPAAFRGAGSAAGQAARQWLRLVDEQDWQASWSATALSFRSMNSVAVWEAASQQARVPLGAVVSRSAAGEETIPAPPAGLQIVRFRTDFSNKSGAVETLSLAREADGWRVAGYLID